MRKEHGQKLKGRIRGTVEAETILKKTMMPLRTSRRMKETVTTRCEDAATGMLQLSIKWLSLQPQTR